MPLLNFLLADGPTAAAEVAGPKLLLGLGIFERQLVGATHNVVHRFYDLSHLNKDFMDFTGNSPTDYLRLRHRFHVENPNHCLDVGPLPID